jgi:hypothetical protein
MVRFSELMAGHDWKPIPNCPGRYVLSTKSVVSPEQLLGADVKVRRYRVSVAKDPVFVACLDDGGLISYLRPDGTYVHTLNSLEGFERKLLSIGIDLEDSRRNRSDI